MNDTQNLIVQNTYLNSLSNKNIPFHEYTKGKAVPFMTTVHNRNNFQKYYDYHMGDPRRTLTSRKGVVISIPATYLGKKGELHEFSTHHHSLNRLMDGIITLPEHFEKISFLIDPKKPDMCILQLSCVEINKNMNPPKPGTYGLLLTKDLVVGTKEKMLILHLTLNNCYFVHGSEHNDYSIIKEETVSPEMTLQLTANLEMDMDYQWYSDSRSIIKRIQGLQKDVETCTRTIEATLDNCPENDARTYMLFQLRQKRDQVQQAHDKLQAAFQRCRQQWENERVNYEKTNNTQALHKMEEIESRYEKENQQKKREYT